MFRCALLKDVRLDYRWRDAIDKNIRSGQLLSQTLRQRDDASFGCAVVRCVGVAFLTSNGGNIEMRP